MVNSYLKNKAIIYLYLVINLDFLFTTRRSIYRYRQHNSRSHNIVRVTGLSTCSDKSKFLLLLTLKFCPLWIWLSPVTLMHLHYCSYSVLSVMMLHLRSAWSKLLCPNALYNVNFCGGPWPDCIEKITNSLKEILQMPAFLFFFFSIKARQEHREPRSLLVTKIVQCLHICVFVFALLERSHALCIVVIFSETFVIPWAVVLLFYCSFPFVLNIVFEPPTTKSLRWKSQNFLVSFNP